MRLLRSTGVDSHGYDGTVYYETTTSRLAPEFFHIPSDSITEFSLGIRKVIH